MGCCHMRRCSHNGSGGAQRQRRRVGGGRDSSRRKGDVTRGEEREEGGDEGREAGREGEGERRERGRHLRRYWLAAGGALDRAGHFARTPPVVARQPTHARGEPRASGRRRRSSRNRPRSGGRARGTTRQASRQAGQQRAAGGEGQPEQSSRRDVGVGELAARCCACGRERRERTGSLCRATEELAAAAAAMQGRKSRGRCLGARVEKPEASEQQVGASLQGRSRCPCHASHVRLTSRVASQIRLAHNHSKQAASIGPGTPPVKHY